MPRARGISRLNIGPPSPRASTMTRSPTLRIPWSSALAMRALEHLLDHPRPAVRHVLERVHRVVGVLVADQVQQRQQLPNRDPGEAVLGLKFDGRAHCPWSQSSGIKPLSTEGRNRSVDGPGLLLAALGRLAAVGAERPGRGELAELMPDHVLGHEQLHEDLAVVHGEVLSDELGHDRAGPRPRLDRFPVAGLFGPYTFSSSRSTTYGPFFSERPMDPSCPAEGRRAASASVGKRQRRSTTGQIFNWPYRTLRRRRMMAEFDGLRRRRVLPPFASLPVGEHG